jgi:hypothetical protein
VWPADSLLYFAPFFGRVAGQARAAQSRTFQMPL